MKKIKEEVMPQKQITQVKVVLQGKAESFLDYERRINGLLKDLPYNTFVFPSAAADGRMCSIINYRSYTPATTKDL